MTPAGEQGDQRTTWEGFSDALARAVELVGVTVIFVLGGLWLDSRLGTRPLFIVVLGLLAVIGLGIREFYEYQARIAKEEEGKPWTHRKR